ncbi:MAG: ATP-binding protein [Deltaproteobacteria bacterium]|nr:ATP-binding protein [Deltaproteobacteria bacterium]
MGLAPSSPLIGGGLRFDRSGTRLSATEPDAISVVELATYRTIRIALTDVRGVAGFDDQLWIATSDDHLLRVDHAGRTIGTSVALPFTAQPILAPAPCGPAAAIWGRTALVAGDGGDLARTELAEATTIIPITGRRHVIVRGSRVILPSGIVAQLPSHTSVLDGAVMLDGKSVVLQVAHAGGRRLMVVSLGNGQVVQRCAIASAAARLAIRRGIAVVQLEPRTLWTVDLQSGHELGSIQLERDVDDFAIDPTGTCLAVRDTDGNIELLERARSRLVAPVASGEAPSEAPPPETPIAAAPPATPATPDTPVIGIASSAELLCPELRALEPRQAVAIDHAEARRQLAHELQSVSLWTFGAIAEAWDTRRIGYGNECSHPYELEVGAILGISNGFAGQHVTAARELLGEHERGRAADPQARAAATPLGQLLAELQLGHRAIDILLVIAAAALRGEIARLYGILANDDGRAIIDELLVQQVLAGRHDRADVAAELDARAPLVRLGIVRMSGRRARPFAELSIDPVVLDRLRGVPLDLGMATTVRVATSGLAALDIPRAVVDEACAALARVQGVARIMMRGRIGSGRRTLLATLAAVAGRDLAVIDASALPRDARSFVGELALSLRRAHLAGLVPCIAHLESVTFDEHPGRDVAAETLRAHPGPIAVVASSEDVAPFPPGHVVVELPVLAETERRAVWQRVLAESSCTVRDVDALAARYRVGPGVIRSAVAAAADVPGSDATPAIEAYIRQTRDTRLGQYARRVTRLASWSSVVLPPDILDSLRELVARVRHGRKVFDTWNMSRVMATSRGLTALFQGPPGTGKTLVAGVIARELGLDLYQIDLSKVMSKWIGETERNLSTIFDAAEDGQVVLLFDESDSLFAKRTEVRSSNDRYANLEVNYLLQRLDSFEGIAILTTNSGSSIDQAFKRRLSFRLSFPFPDEETREQLWRAHLPPELPIDGTLTLDALARKYQLSGGYIRNACLRAAFLAAQDETALHQHHLERAVALEFAEFGKLSSSGAID